MHTRRVAEDRSVLFREGLKPDTVLAYGPHPDQICDLYSPAEGSDVRRFPIVFLHGGYWRPEYDRMHARSAAGGLAAAGWRTVLVEYRRVPGDPDTTVRDVFDAIRCASKAFDQSRVVVVGHSAGGHLALLTSAHPELPVHAIVALAPLSDLAMADAWELDEGAVRQFLGADASTRPDLDPHLSPEICAPTSIMHGSEDSIVPCSMSEGYGRRAGVPVVELPNVGHYELIDPLSIAWPELLAHLEESLR